jgi:putative transposase
MILNRHDRITIHGIQYCLPDETSDGYVLRRVEAVDLAVPFTHAELDRLRDRPDWALDEGFFDAARLKGKAAHGAMSMNDLTAKEQGVVLWRWEYCTLYERLRHAGLVDGSDEAMAAAIDIIDESVSKLPCAVMAPPARKKLQSGKGKKASTKARAGAVRTVVVRQRPSVSTLRRWLRRLKEFGYYPWSLRDKYQNCGRGAQITGQAYRLLVEHAERYATPERPSYAQLHLDLRVAVKDHNKGLAPESQIACPSKKALRAYIAGMSAFYVFAQREGIEKAKARFAVVTAGPQVVKPYERLELDHWTVNLRSLLTRMGMWDRLPPGVQAELGRMYPCVAIDVATRCIVGACLSRAPSSEDTLAVLEMAVSDKSDIARAASSVTPWDMRAGLTNASVGMDGGSAFANEATRRAIAALGASADYPPGGVPHLRAYVERFFRTVDVGLIARLAGRTFENILARGDADPDAIACITAEDMSWAIVR